MATERTPQTDEPGDLEQIVRLLARHDVEFLVVGGQAEWLFGSPRATFDVDICYRRTQETLKRLAEALKEIDPRLRDAPPGLPFNLDAESLALGDNFTFATRLGDLDLFGTLEPVGGFDALIERAEVYELDDIQVPVIALDDLIRIKEHLGRPKDQEALAQLRAIKAERNRPRD